MSTSTVLFLTLTMMAGHSQIYASSWNQFRGPDGSGVAEACNPPVKIEADHVAWSMPVPAGHSSPVLSAKRIFLTAIQELPKDKAGLKKRLDGMFAWVDRDKDGFWTKKEFVEHMSGRRGRPILVAIRPGGKGDVTDSHVSWQVQRSIPEIPSPIFYGNRLYLARKGGLVSAVDATNGKVLYRERLGVAGQYSASPVIANDHLYLVSNQGLVSVVKLGNEFQILHQHDLQEPVVATPAFDESTIYIRTAAKLFAFRTRRKHESS